MRIILAGLSLSVLLSLTTAQAAEAVQALPGAKCLNCATITAGELETVILTITLNHVAKGEFFLQRTPQDDYLIKLEDVPLLGLRGDIGKPIEVAGEHYIALRSLPEVRIEYDAESLVLNISVPPALLPTQYINLLPPRQANVITPTARSAFMNYSANYAAADGFSFQGLSVNHELGMRSDDLLFLSGFSYTRTRETSQWLRLMSNATYDRRSELQRIVFGDFFTSSGDLGSTLNLGGINFSKQYRIDPYFVKNRLEHFSGSVDSPSEIEVYLDGTKIRSERLAPGAFELRNLSQYGGARNVEIVVKDSFGREQRVAYPAYFTDLVLQRGLHEYNYGLGFIREDFGQRSNDYGPLAASFFHRYGLRDDITLGIHGEASQGRYALGPQTTVALGGLGTLNLDGALSHDGAHSGWAHLLAYDYQSRVWSATLFLRKHSEDFVTLLDGNDKIRSQLNVGLGYAIADLGTVGVNFTSTKKYLGEDQQSVTATYNLPFAGKANLLVSYRDHHLGTEEDEFFIGIIYQLAHDTSVSAQYRRARAGHGEALQVQKNPPLGEGWGYRLGVQQTDSSTLNTRSLSPSLQYNARYAILRADYLHDDTDDAGADNYQFSVAGGMGYVGNRLSMSRPINDSFGIIKLADVAGVRAYVNNQEIGRTDAKGELFIPNLSSYYDNQITISDKDLPINYSVSEVEKFISPPLRSGSLIDFHATRIQAVSGRLKITLAQGSKAVEFYEVKLHGNDTELSFPTGRDGEFYLENIAPGRYQADFEYETRTCRFVLDIPHSDETIIELGEVVCAPER